MNASQVYILVTLVVLLVIAALVFFVSGKKQEKRLTPLAGIAFACIVAGLMFGENRIIGYGLLGVGVLLAVLDIFHRSRHV